MGLFILGQLQRFYNYFISILPFDRNFAHSQLDFYGEKLTLVNFTMRRLSFVVNKSNGHFSAVNSTVASAMNTNHFIFVVNFFKINIQVYICCCLCFKTIPSFSSRNFSCLRLHIAQEQVFFERYILNGSVSPDRIEWMLPVSSFENTGKSTKNERSWAWAKS